MAKELLRSTKYTLFSNRTLFPEKFPYPRGSVEAKRQLLISLSPMLTDAEKSRQKDTISCERITGCKSVKIKTRSSSYEYTDTATNSVITPEEFEHRYYAYLDQTTPSRVLRLAAVTAAAANTAMSPITVTSAECSPSVTAACDDEVLMFPMDSPSMSTLPTSSSSSSNSDAIVVTPPQATEDSPSDELDISICSSVSRGNRSRTKRMTLSPKSARDMLLLAASENETSVEEKETTTSAVVITGSSTDISSSTAPTDTSVAQESAPVVEYSVPASFDPFADEEVDAVNTSRIAARNKRMTLSPSSARRMLSLSIEEDELNTSTASDSSDDLSSGGTSIEATHPLPQPLELDLPLTTTSTASLNNSISTTSTTTAAAVVDRDAKVVADFSSELEAILADGPGGGDLATSSVKFTVYPRSYASSSSPAPVPPVVFAVFPGVDSVAEVVPESSVHSVSPNPPTNTNSVTSISKTADSPFDTLVATSVPADMPASAPIVTATDVMPQDTRAPQDFKSEAMSRLYARYSVARWRYQWELASFDAVVRARDRLYSLFAGSGQ